MWYPDVRGWEQTSQFCKKPVNYEVAHGSCCVKKCILKCSVHVLWGLNNVQDRISHSAPVNNYAERNDQEIFYGEPHWIWHFISTVYCDQRQMLLLNISCKKFPTHRDRRLFFFSGTDNAQGFIRNIQMHFLERIFRNCFKRSRKEPTGKFIGIPLSAHFSGKFFSWIPSLKFILYIFRNSFQSLFSYIFYPYPISNFWSLDIWLSLRIFVQKMLSTR